MSSWQWFFNALAVTGAAGQLALLLTHVWQGRAQRRTSVAVQQPAPAAGTPAGLLTSADCGRHVVVDQDGSRIRGRLDSVSHWDQGDFFEKKRVHLTLKIAGGGTKWDTTVNADFLVTVEGR